MSEPLSPPARRLASPRWLDARLVTGVLLVLLSVVLGARVIAEADDRQPVWSATRDLAPGAALEAGDVEVQQVRLDGNAARYLGARGAPPEGYVLTRPIGAGELLPAAALSAAANTEPRRLVTLPVDRFHYPAGLRSGERVDVYVTVPPSDDAPETRPEQVLAGAVVSGVDAGDAGLGGVTAQAGVSLAVAPKDVDRVVAAVQSGAIDLVRVPQGQP